MPLLGSKHRTSAEYFTSLDELDTWKASARHKLTSPLKYVARTERQSSGTAGKLLVCHDYKGGYTESPFALAYTFNYWNVCDSFVYFSHHRVTIPPPGWITAAHRQGVKMLGTLIFEDGAEPDCLRLLIGKLPQARTGVAKQGSQVSSLPISSHYARVLAELADERGFDGYLLNFECPLQGGLEQTRALSAWITLLQAELCNRVGEHTEVSWYDSVIVTGMLAWQDRLNSINLPFFLASRSLFSNYTWRSDYPSKTASYFLSLDPSHIRTKTLQDIYMGIDTWGRGSHGGGGFGAYKALSHITPQSLGLSVAFFGQAWTWESEQDKEGWTWEKWWDYERLLWAGPLDDKEDVRVPDVPREEGEPECECAGTPFKPVSSFFNKSAPPDPTNLAMHVAFSPGVGRAWFVEGKKVYEGGWTDVHKQTSVGDLVWPKPDVAWEGDDETASEFRGQMNVTPSICMTDGWNGGSSLRLRLSDRGGEDRSVYRCIWVPVQSVSLTAQTSYTAVLVHKLEEHADIDVSLSAKGVNTSIKPLPDNDLALAVGWTRLSIEFSVDNACTAALGLCIAIVCEDAERVSCSMLLGQLNVFPTPTSNAPLPSIIWADYQVSDEGESATLTWETALSYRTLPGLTITSPEDPKPAWETFSDSGLPRFVYYNVYASDSDGYVAEEALWIGTSGYEGQEKMFVMESANVPFENFLGKRVRFFVQGVLDNGDVIPWERCVYVDSDKS